MRRLAARPSGVPSGATGCIAPRDTGPFITVRVGSRISDVERRLIFATLEQCKGSKAQAAEALGVSVKTLYNRLLEYGAIGDAVPEATGTDGP